ncbi:MAG: four helix bundle protein [Verrucomicrobia bacterium]|nr:four helix bundle protein [Verrucomicrobiota bacterium]
MSIERKSTIRTHADLEVFQRAFEAAMIWFNASRHFPVEERYALTDQGRRSSRSVCANLAEAWRKRRYPAAFLSKLNECEGEAAETQVWIQFAVKCGYLTPPEGQSLMAEYDAILGMLVAMIRRPEAWHLP